MSLKGRWHGFNVHPLRTKTTSDLYFFAIHIHNTCGRMHIPAYMCMHMPVHIQAIQASVDIGPDVYIDVYRHVPTLALCIDMSLPWPLCIDIYKKTASSAGTFRHDYCGTFDRRRSGYFGKTFGKYSKIDFGCDQRYFGIRSKMRVPKSRCRARSWHYKHVSLPWC